MVCRAMFSVAFWGVSAAQDVFLEPVKASSVPVVARQPAQDNFEAQCTSDDDHGWPRFQSADELLASPWNAYFMEVYGELPSTYPVCINDFWFLNQAAYEAANITGHELVQPDEVQEGDLFQQSFFGHGALMIYHSVYQPLPANTWTEIQHTVTPTELKGFWVFRVPGTGVWANTGNTRVFPHGHMEAITFLRENCSTPISIAWPRSESDIFGSCGREKGLDSIQFEPQAGVDRLQTFGQIGVTEMVLINSNGNTFCGTEDASQTEFRSGWMASRQCDCENIAIPETCGFLARSPFGYSDPPMCAVQTGFNFWKACDPTACLTTTCKLPTRV